LTPWLRHKKAPEKPGPSSTRPAHPPAISFLPRYQLIWRLNGVIVVANPNGLNICRASSP
jgi:hypothetical protein